MRHHGWELPYHPLQIVAVAVFFALVFGFYVFFVPFTGSRILEISIFAVYSPTIVIVFVVYIWCVATNPADVGVRISKKRVLGASSVTSSRAAGKENESTAEPKADKRPSPLHSENQNAGEVAADDSNMKQSSNSFSRVLLSGLAYLVQICTHNSSADPLPTEHGILYCTLCKVEIFKYSKHCRVCDKCVDGFDHHCRWLNNCVGRKNYRGFVVLMVSGIIMLILQWSVGLWVLVHFFLNLKHFKSMIASKLGSSFSSIAYLIVVALCTLLAMAATYPLAQLFCFHVLLMKKGISTFDYIIAMKEQQLKVGGEPAHSPLTSPASSVTTANSGASSSGVLQGQAWCTPPRLFFDHEQGISQPESSHPRKDNDQGLSSTVLAEKIPKRKTSVKLSSWALASLKKEDVLYAATVARNKSSVLHPVAPSSEKQVVTEASSSYNSSKGMIAEFVPPLEIRRANRKLTEPNLNRTDQSFVVSSWQNGKLPLDTYEQQDGIGKNSGNTNKHTDRGKKVLNPVQMEARNAFKTSREFSVSGNPVSSPESSEGSSEARLDMLDLPHPSVVPTDWPWIEKSVTDGYDGSGCESTDDSDWAKSLPHAMNKEKVLSDARRGSLQYSPRRKVFGPEISAKSSTFSPRTGDETRAESSIIPNADGADERLSRLGTTNDMASQKGSQERTRISKYMITDPSHLHL